MKYLYLLLVLFCINKTSGQNVAPADNIGKDIIRLRLEGDSIVLREGWRIREGIDDEWLSESYDDSQWRTIDPRQNIKQLGLFNSTKPVTLRLKFILEAHVPDSLFLCVTQSVASKVFLNGTLIAQWGRFSDTGTSVNAMSPLNRPLKINIEAGKPYTMVVQAEFEELNNFLAHPAISYPLFNATLAPEKAAFDLYHNHLHVFPGLARVGMFFLLFIVHFIGYLFYPAYRIQLWFSLTALAWCLQSVILMAPFFTGDLDDSIKLSTLLHFFDITALVLFVVVIWNLLGSLRFIELVPLIIFMAFGLFADDLVRILGLAWVFTVLFNPLYIAWLSYGPLKKNNPSARYIFFGSLIWGLLFLAFLTRLPFYGADLIASVLFNLAVLALPISISMAISQNFRFINLNLQSQMAENSRLAREKEEILTNQKSVLETQVKERTNELEVSLHNLEATQSQLIQSEKMASLGELTAGIAHEIQNPLNFVNNFSEVNTELLSEMKEAIAKGNLQSATDLANDAIGNEEKINYHGKRADGIVKSMLQHSRASSGQKELTDINTLCEEYMRLAYHGFRAKDKSFNTKVETDFDQDLPNINIVPQDIGRVILNVINNAFYAVSEKSSSHLAGYTPMVFVSTKNSGSGIEISVRDNGSGIPESIREKIFQPFFTTKPTGLGTGLGLSLSYDIIKAHGGDLKVETKTGEGSVFTVILPLK